MPIYEYECRGYEGTIRAACFKGHGGGLPGVREPGYRAIGFRFCCKLGGDEQGDLKAARSKMKTSKGYVEKQVADAKSG